MTALRANDAKQAQRLATDKVEPMFAALERGIGALIDLQVDVARKEYVAAVARYQVIRAVSLGAIALGLLSSAVLGFLLVRSIGRQLGAEPGAAAALAQSVAAARRSRPARSSRPRRRWSNSVPPSGRTPTTPAMPASWP